jgi:hypothetical protein
MIGPENADSTLFRVKLKARGEELSWGGYFAPR